MLNAPNDLHVPINLRKKDLPAVTIYGDAGEGKELAKIIWGLIAGQDVQLLTPESEDDLLATAYNSALIFIKINAPDDPKIGLADKLSNMDGVVADVVAITEEPEIRARLHVMSQSFDMIFNREILDLPEFHRVLIHKIRRGVRRLEARIQEDEYKSFKAFLSASADAFIVFDNQKRIFFVSDYYHRVFQDSIQFFSRGIPVQRAFEAIAREMKLDPSDMRYDEIKDFWIRMRGTYEFSHNNGRIYRMVATPLPDNQGTIISTTDVTVYKHQEEKLAKQQADLQEALEKEQEASALQKQFIAMVSHEFRTPLTIVDGNAQLLQRRLDTTTKEEIKARAKTIRSAVSRLINMMEAVLSSSLLRTGRLELRPERFSLIELIDELCEEHVNLSGSLIIDRDIHSLPPQLLMDKKVMTIILSNLLSNAVKYSPKSPHIHVHGYIDEVGNMIISVKDNGVGIPQSEIPHVFERFFRATTSSGIVGSGVGLSLVADLMKLHNGMIRVESDVGQGSCFTVTFPASSFPQS
jgi:signal transduction histidine kinase